ncbi:hypothetical protein BG000_005039, partial [Podila horticola]
QRFTSVDSLKTSHCLRDLDIKEYQPFKLKNTFLDTFVSKIDYDNMLVGDLPGDNTFHELKFCIVSTDDECNSPLMSDCISENVEYRIRVFGPVKGYLYADDDVVTIQPGFEGASSLTLFRDRDGGLRISQWASNGDSVVLASLEPTAAYIWQESIMYDNHEWFELVQA